jgi:hypothetical protein
MMPSIFVPCGWNPTRRFVRRGACGRWMGYGEYRGRAQVLPHFRRRRAYCCNCIKDFEIVRERYGMAWKPVRGGGAR